MNSNKTLYNADLLTAIRLMRKDSSKEPLFLEALYQAKLLCPVFVDTSKSPKDANGSVALSEDTQVSFAIITDSFSAQYLMAFTDWDELSKRNQGKYQQIVVYTFGDYKSLLMSRDMQYRGVVINPFSDNVVLGKEIFARNNMRFETEKSNESIMIGLPKDYPTGMVDRLKQYFQETKLVEIAYLLWMVRGQEAGYLLVLGTKASPQQLFPEIGEVCKPYLDEKLMDMVLLNSAFSKSAVGDQKPFYKA